MKNVNIGTITTPQTDHVMMSTPMKAMTGVPMSLLGLGGPFRILGASPLTGSIGAIV